MSSGSFVHRSINRNGEIDPIGRLRAEGGEPFRFWINDDDDDPASEVSGDDVPDGATIRDCDNAIVDGMRDLIDFFPVKIELDEILSDTSKFSYHLKQAHGAVNFAYTDLTATNISEYLVNPVVAQSLSSASTVYVSVGGVELDDAAFLNQIAATSEAVLLLEGGFIGTTKPFVLEVKEKSTGNVVALAELPLRLCNVEKLYNRVDLRPVVHDWPSGAATSIPAEQFVSGTDPGKDFVFVHGYNVNEEQARGWFAEMFKRLHWSGSTAEFHGVSWVGDQTQIAGKVTPNYHVNVIHAYMTALSLAGYVNSIGGADVLSAHSLGNMVCSAAIANHSASVGKYFMIDAAVALEAYDPDPANQNLNMVHAQWGDPSTGGIEEQYYAAEWHVLFASDDWRSRLHWHSNFSSVAPLAFNFYSSGEEVLETHPHGNDPGILDVTLPMTGNYAWALQEKLKGRMWTTTIVGGGSTSGGWGFNDHYVLWDNPLLTWLVMPTEPKIDEPLFKKDDDAAVLYDLSVGTGTLGSNYAQQHYGEILATQISARSLPAGANLIPALETVSRNFDMNVEYTHGWPAERGNSRWLHGDIKDISYLYVKPLFDAFTEKGELK